MKTCDPAWSTTLSGVIRHCEANSVQYAARTPYDSTIPLGMPVVPLRYMMLKASPGLMIGIEGAASIGTPAASASTSAASVTSSVAPASAASVATASARSGGLSGTVAAPSRADAQKTS